MLCEQVVCVCINVCTYARVCVFVGLSGEPGQSVRCSNGGFKDKRCGEFAGCLLPTSQPFSTPPPPPQREAGRYTGRHLDRKGQAKSGRLLLHLMGQSQRQTVRETARCSSSLPPSLAWAEPLQTPAACLPLCSFLSCGCSCCFDACSRCCCCRRCPRYWFASFEQLLFVAGYLLVFLCISSSVYAYSRLLCVCARSPQS